MSARDSTIRYDNNGAAGISSVMSECLCARVSLSIASQTKIYQKLTHRLQDRQGAGRAIRNLILRAVRLRAIYALRMYLYV